MAKFAFIALLLLQLRNSAIVHAAGPGDGSSNKLQMSLGPPPAKSEKPGGFKVASDNGLSFDKVTGKAETPAPAIAPGQSPAAEGKTLDNSQIRKIIASQPDPSMVLEPLAEEPKKAKVELPKAPVGPPARPIASSSVLPGQQENMSKNMSRIGRNAQDAPPVPEVSVILVGRMFYPARIRLKAGIQARLYFTTTNEKAAAVIVEQLQIQRWVAKEGEKSKDSDAPKDNLKFEASREVAKNRVSEVVLDPKRGTYSFHDAISGAKGQIVVE